MTSERIIRLNITDTIEQPAWIPMTAEENADLQRRLPWRDRKVYCQICIITDHFAEATHTCESCELTICDNEANHILDHERIDNEALKAYVPEVVVVFIS